MDTVFVKVLQTRVFELRKAIDCMDKRNSLRPVLVETLKLNIALLKRLTTSEMELVALKLQ